MRPFPGERLGAWCGVVGPCAFVASWAVGSAVREGYDPLVDTISRLAEDGAGTRPLLTAGLVAFGVLVPVWAGPLGRRLQSRAVTAAATAAGVTSLGVAAFPLTVAGGTTRDSLHVVAAAGSYVAMALTPLLAVRPLQRLGRPRAAAASATVGVLAAVSLAVSAVVDEQGSVGSGAFQRLGLTVVDGWHVVAAAAVLRAVSSGR